MTEALLRLGEARLRRVSAANHRFFEHQADALPRAAAAMAERFRRGGRLFVFGTGPAASDAHHVAVEFLHPVIVGQRALPAIAVAGDAAARIRLVGRPPDIAIAMSDRGDDPLPKAMLDAARETDLLTIGFGGAGRPPAAEHAFVCAEADPTVVQEIRETACHVLHELVHLFLEHRRQL